MHGCVREREIERVCVCVPFVSTLHTTSCGISSDPNHLSRTLRTLQEAARAAEAAGAAAPSPGAHDGVTASSTVLDMDTSRHGLGLVGLADPPSPSRAGYAH